MNHFRIVLQPGQAEQCSQVLAPGVFTVGSGSDADIQCKALGVSRKHAQLTIFESGGLMVEDLASTNGTFCEGERITQIAFDQASQIYFGQTLCQLMPVDEAGEMIAISASLGHPFVGKSEIPLAGPAPNLTESIDLTRQSFQMLAKEMAQSPNALLSRAIHAMLEQWLQDFPLNTVMIVDQHADSCLYLVGPDQKDLPTFAFSHESGLQIKVWGSAAMTRRLNPAAIFVLDLLNARPKQSDRCQPAPRENYGVNSQSQAIKQLTQQCARIAKSKLPVLILGESGTGKELLARWIHQQSDRANQPFVAINCAALPSELLEAELFGIEKGTATGVDARAGLLEQAHKGTLFLDELGDMHAQTQAKLLRALENEAIVRLGGSKVVPINVRFISATNQSLLQNIENGHFRLDLYHRLAGYEANLPPLRERMEDLPALASHFFQLALEEHQKTSPGITSKALSAMLEYQWPGNIRELRNEIARGVLLLDMNEPLNQSSLSNKFSSSQPVSLLTLSEQLARAEQRAFAVALSCTDGKASDAMKLLDISKTVYYQKLKQIKQLEAE
ncbi:MAG: sigma 54-interacting transcriptional regulator [bacterium]